MEWGLGVQRMSSWRGRWAQSAGSHRHSESESIKIEVLGIDSRHHNRNTAGNR